ncbi:alkaline phosphatase family protein [Actinoallomurus purpureus]|uniref:alkaline phosphatase family protein n=1 Tax=Actinoallomurus purpureus TaxID=478114 RepID=UPI002092144C|nr:nucleotide pyrophosphatase/phosphodiesterase family protein [Actinoallomurus purpureus]MCO6008811.1 alkaline phosphatase family protein [Actinoallomurus purpureus]
MSHALPAHGRESRAGPAHGRESLAVPAYGRESLAELGPSVLAALGVPGEANVLGLPSLPRACLLLIDGLGWELLRAHAGAAPFLSSLAGRPLTAGFPATTATSLASLGTGRPPGGHGMFGYQVAVPGEGRLLNCLRWSDGIDPLTWQPATTIFDRAVAAGVSTAHVSARAFENSGLTRAVYRGARYLPADALGPLVAHAEHAVREGERAFVTVYHGDLDATGHVHGSRSAAWRHHLTFVDLLARRLAEVMPPDAALYITADHGMTDPAGRIDVDAEPDMRAGVALLGGEARARHVYAEPGAAGDVLAAWRERLEGQAWVLTREEAIADGLFGPVAASLAPRIGDVVAVPYADVAIVATRAEPIESTLVGMHGSLVAAEQLVPLLSPGEAR